jgi:hypothetical protein
MRSAVPVRACADLEQRRTGYVLAVACDHHVAVAAVKRRPASWPLACPDRRGPANG